MGWNLLRREKELCLRHNQEPHSRSQREDYHRRFTETVDDWLQAGLSRCILPEPACKGACEVIDFGLEPIP